jgi:hypothetical protein
LLFNFNHSFKKQIMPNFIEATVYQINDNSLRTPIYMAWDPSTVMLRAVPSNQVVTAGPLATRVYGIVQQLPSGLVVKGNQYYVIETVQQLVTAAG